MKTAIAKCNSWLIKATYTIDVADNLYETELHQVEFKYTRDCNYWVPYSAVIKTVSTVDESIPLLEMLNEYWNIIYTYNC